MSQTTRTCVQCGIEFTRPKRARGACCSSDCLKARQRCRPRPVPAPTPCAGCGKPIVQVAGGVRRYCSDACRPGCTVSDCPHPASARGLCDTHARRVRHGLDLTAPIRQRFSVAGECLVEGCGEARSKRGWCADHYRAWWSHGDPLFDMKRWAPRADGCRMCGAPTASHLRQYCSHACRHAEQRALRDQPEFRDETPCQVCGDWIPLVRRNGRAIARRGTLTCLVCRPQVRLRKLDVSVESLAAEHGPICRICGCFVDLTLASPDPLRASIDHIIPRARGGTDERSNLQLCHLHCNVIKGASVAA
jgi:hypothetical protein